MTKTGMMIGSMGFMAPEQISGHPVPATDIFAWGVTVAYAAAGQSPFGAGNAHSILYRIMYGDADVDAVPDSLRPLVEAALAKDPQRRPTAQQLLDQLMSPLRSAARMTDAPTQVISSPTWATGLSARPPELPGEPSPPVAERPTAEGPSPARHRAARRQPPRHPDPVRSRSAAAWPPWPRRRSWRSGGAVPAVARPARRAPRARPDGPARTRGTVQGRAPPSPAGPGPRPGSTSDSAC